jgi:hypothetical protein
MKFNELLSVIGDEPVFKTSMLLAGTPSGNVIRRQLDRWVKSGKIVRLRRGVYALASPYAAKHPHPFRIANMLRNASYVSLESALAYYGVIPEFTPVTMSVTTGRPETITNESGKFVFRHIKKSLFFGFDEKEIYPGQTAMIATPEKALVDRLYLTPGSDDYDYLRELRLTLTPYLNMEKLAVVVEQCGSAKIQRAVAKLAEISRAEGEYIEL